MEKDSNQVFSSFGMKTDDEMQEEQQGLLFSEEQDEDSQEESGEPEQVDTSDNEPEEEFDEEVEEESEEVDEESDEDFEDDEDDDYRAKWEEADARARKMQSQVDKANANAQKVQAQVLELYNELQQVKTTQTQANTVQDTPDFGSDDDIPDNKTVSQMIQHHINQAMQQAAPKPQAQKPAGQEQVWLSQQSDLNDVADYIESNQLKGTPELEGIPTMIGRYQYVKGLMVQEELKANQQKTLKRKKKRSAPPTGGSGKGKKTSRSGLSQIESNIINIGRKVGLDLDVRNIG